MKYTINDIDTIVRIHVLNIDKGYNFLKSFFISDCIKGEAIR